MHGWGHMMNFWYGGTLMWILFLIVIVVVVYFILQSTKPRSYDSSFRKTPRETSIDILKRRYARGEITKEEFEQMKKDLQS
ncbi:electron transporter RnfE [Candidatus Aerophobetes bacterium Ae_b3b]|nr:MAG: electron transporter RnfE [Candidatus Aerophobetes bacterium Ae_b3b]